MRYEMFEGDFRIPDGYKQPTMAEGRFSLLLVKKVEFQATEMALCAAFLQYNNKKGFALFNFGQICSVNHQNPVILRSKTVDIVVEVSC